MDWNFYKGRSVLVTGHTGFKGGWLCRLLINAGANVTGYSLEAPTEPNLFQLSHLSQYVNSVTGDIRDLERLRRVFDETKPEIVIHMAAQPIVRASYENPVYTFDVNVMGTVNLLECVRKSDTVKSVINVTTDKVYLNREWEWGYREDEELKGYDPYSNSKSCSELVTYSFRKSYFDDRKLPVTTVRAGNVIGGGDFAKDRIIPDCVRAAAERKDIIVRNPFSIRPYQHVLEPVVVYLMIAEKQYYEYNMAGCYNVGPDEMDCRTTAELVTLFCNIWNRYTKEKINWKRINENRVHEASFLKLDCSRLKRTFDWCPRWNLNQAVEKVVEWNQVFFIGEDVEKCMDRQIEDYFRHKYTEKTN